MRAAAVGLAWALAVACGGTSGADSIAAQGGAAGTAQVSSGSSGTSSASGNSGSSGSEAPATGGTTSGAAGVSVTGGAAGVATGGEPQAGDSAGQGGASGESTTGGSSGSGLGFDYDAGTPSSGTGGQLDAGPGGSGGILIAGSAGVAGTGGESGSSDCECSDGPCCDGCRFLPAEIFCFEETWEVCAPPERECRFHDGSIVHIVPAIITIHGGTHCTGAHAACGVTLDVWDESLECCPDEATSCRQMGDPGTMNWLEYEGEIPTAECYFPETPSNGGANGEADAG